MRYAYLMTDIFRRIAARVSAWAGTATVFLGAIVVVVVWAVTGPAAHYSNTWQLIINTGTTIITFLMVFLIQNTQNRDGKAVQIKLDELIRATKGAQIHYIGLEDLSDAELAQLDTDFKEIAARPGSARAIAKLQDKIMVEHARRKHSLHTPAMMANLLHRQPVSGRPDNPSCPPTVVDDVRQPPHHSL